MLIVFLLTHLVDVIVVIAVAYAFHCYLQLRQHRLRQQYF